MKLKVKYIIFDMDGLLVDTERFYSDGWLYAVEKNEVDLSEDVVRSWVGKGKEDSIQALLAVTKDMDIVNQIVKDREKYIYQQLEEGNILEKKHVGSTLKHLKEKGYILGVASSTDARRGIDILKHLSLYNYIDYFAFGDEVPIVKPSPYVYELALKKAGMREDESLAIEDSITGATAAIAAGINVVLVPDEHFLDQMDGVPEGIKYVYTDVSKILDLVD